MTVLSFFKRRRPPKSDSEQHPRVESQSAAIQIPVSKEAPVARVSPYQAPQEVLPEEAYTHGFQNIYSLENVDVRTVRPMGSKDQEPKLEVKEGGRANREEPKPKTKPKRKVPEFLADQLEFDLGPTFRNWIRPFRLEEPIQVLELSAIAERALLDHGKRFLKDLLEIGETDTRFKGLGQGHIDEIETKLDAYLEDSPRKCSGVIDFRSLLRSVLGGEDRRSLYLWLQPYGLESLFNLSPSEQAEVRHLTPDKRLAMVEASRLEIVGERKRELAQERLKQAIEAFVIPWLFGRHGYGSQEEVMERLERMSQDSSEARSVMAFLTNVYCESESPLKRTLQEVEPGVFAVDWPRVQEYRQIVNLAKTYFYTPGLSYPLQDLVAWIERESALKWQGYPEGKVERILRLSCQFRVRRAEEGVVVRRR